MFTGLAWVNTGLEWAARGVMLPDAMPCATTGDDGAKWEDSES